MTAVPAPVSARSALRKRSKQTSRNKEDRLRAVFLLCFFSVLWYNAHMGFTLFSGEHIEYLRHGVGVVVSPAHTFGTDALLLADFAAPKPKTRACDLGTGCGIIPLFWKSRGLCGFADGVELQEAAASQFARGICGSGLTDSLAAHCADLKDVGAFLRRGSYDLVTMNPPYKAENAGLKSTDMSARIARHETHCTLDDIARAAALLLRSGGRFCICLRPERLCDAMHAMRCYRLEPKRLRLVAKNSESAPWLCLLEGRREGKSGLQILPGLFLYTKDGALCAEMQRLQQPYSEQGGVDG